MAYTDRLYIQKTNEDAGVKETIADFGIYLKDIPFKPFSEAKDLYSNEWSDENGSDEFIPDVIPLKSYTMDVEFAYKGAKNTAYETIKNFVNYLTGNDGSGAEMMMYSTYAGFGRRGIRYVSLDDSAELERDDDGDILIFKITFKVNDPTYDVTPVYTENNVTGLK